MVPRQDVAVRAHVNAVQIIDGRAGDEEAHGRVVDVDAASGSSASAWCAVLLQGAGADQGHGCWPAAIKEVLLRVLLTVESC